VRLLTCAGVGETVSQVRAAGGEAHGYIVDLADRNAIYRTAEKVKAAIGKVRFLSTKSYSVIF